MFICHQQLSLGTTNDGSIYDFHSILIPICHIILSFCASSVSEVEGCDVAMNLPLYQAVGDGK